MSTKAYLVDPARGNSTLVRPRYSAGLLLRDDDLTAGVDYTRNLSRLLFRSFFGCGVVCGLVVSVEEGCGGKLTVTIAEGIAMNCSGDPIQIPQPVSVTLDPCSGRQLPDKLWVTLCLTDRNCAPRTAMSGCDDTGGNVSTREIAGYEIRILDQTDDCACGCPKQPTETQTANTVSAGAAVTSTSGNTPAVTTGAGKGKRAAAALAQSAVPVGADAAPDCACADPCSPCYRDHYAGICGCSCCDSDCVMLAVVYLDANKAWNTDHSVRRFIRPVLMRDPQVVLDGGGTLCAADTRPEVPPPPSTPVIN